MAADSSMRVGYVVKRYPRYSETFIVTEILAHEAAGLEVEIFTSLPSSDTHFQDIISRVKAPVWYLTPDSPKASDLWTALQQCADESPDFSAALQLARGEDARYVYQALRLAQQARRRGITHLHAHFASSATTIAMLAAKFAGISYTFTAHAKDIFHEDVNPADLAKKIENAAGVITVSDYNLAYLRDRFCAAGSRIHRIYNGMDLPRLSYVPPAERPPLIVSAGRLVEKKGFANLIDACALLRDRGRSFECQIAGEGELEASLRAQIQRLNLAKLVRLTGPQPQSDIFRCIQRGAVFAAPCIIGRDANRDGLPTVLLESMALGTPCVSTAVTGIPEVIRDNETGLMVPQHDPAALANALERLLDDPKLRVRLAASARRLVEDEFDTHRNTRRVREVFCAAARKAGRPEGS